MEENSIWAAWLAGNRIAAWEAANLDDWPKAPPRGAFFVAMDDPGKLSPSQRQALEAAIIELKTSFADMYPQLAALIGAYDQIDDYYQLEGWYWYPNLAAYRQSDSFKQLIRISGVLAIWRERGFPPQCRPLGDADFECD